MMKNIKKTIMKDYKETILTTVWNVHNDQAYLNKIFPMNPSEFEISYSVKSYDKKLPNMDKRTEKRIVFRWNSWLFSSKSNQHLTPNNIK